MSRRVMRHAIAVALRALIAGGLLVMPCAAQRGSGTPPARVAPAAPPRIDPAAYAALRYRYIGPPGNRVIAVAGIPGDPAVYYVGAASGGIWKTTDGGVHWQPIFDDQPVSSIGALAVAPSDPNVVWAGTGESFIRSHISMGWGMFKSTNAGRSWSRAGLESTGRIARVVIDPRDPNVVLVAALGHSYGPQNDRGIYRTTDGGGHWTRTLFANDSTGAIDIVMDPNDPATLYAAMWQIEIHTWGRVSGGAGSSIWKSRDGGATWTRLAGNGLPTRPFGKVGLAVTKANSKRVYALIETGRGTPWNGEPTDVGILWRSDDGGDHWQLVNSSTSIMTRPAYYARMIVEPDNEDEAYFLSIPFSSTKDGGRTLVERTPLQSPGFDNHDIWIDPTNGNRIILANDEGVSISTNRAQTWTRLKLPIAQLYHVTTDNRVPYTVCGNMQDGPSSCGPSNSKFGGADVTGGADIPRGVWYSVGGGESGWATPDPVDPNIVWSSASGRGSVGGIVVRYDVLAKQGRDVEVWPVSANGHPAADVKYRFVWDFPLTISPHDHTKLYVGSQVVHVTTNGGQSWQVISPDLTRNDKSRQRVSGGITPDNLGVEYGDVIHAIAESPLVPGLIWAGTNDGFVQLTRNGGKSWTNVTKNIPGLIPWGTIGNIEPSRFDAGTAYITVDGHQEGNFDPWVYKTTDYGLHWSLIVNGIPKGPLSHARFVKEDPVRRGLLYLGVENALYVSFDDGGNWQPLQLNLPPAPVSGLTVQQHFNDLVVGTYGRGFWILDDLSPLQQLTAEITTSEAHLFGPHAAYRFRQNRNGIREMSDDPTAGHNPEYGASLSYWLKRAPSGDVALSIADSAGQVVRTMSGTKLQGINRVYWDLRYAPSGTPPGASAGSDAGAGRGGGGASVRILAPPGRYTVRLRAAGVDMTRPLVVLKDPDSGGSAREIAMQTAMIKDLAADLASSVQLTSGIQNVRTQLKAMVVKLALDSAARDVRTAADSLEREFAAVEDSLVQQKPGAFYEWPVKLTAKLVYLADHVQSSDHEPTAQALEADAFLKSQLRLVKGEYDALMQKKLAAFNSALRLRGLPTVITVVP